MREMRQRQAVIDDTPGSTWGKHLRKMFPMFGGSDTLPSANKPEDWIYGGLGPGPSQRAAAMSGNIPQLGGPSPLEASPDGRHHGMEGLGHEGLGAAPGGRHFGIDSILGGINKPIKATHPILTEQQKNEATKIDLLGKIAVNTGKSMKKNVV